MNRPKRPRDANQLAKLIVGIATGDVVEKQESKKAVSGRTGGLKGGKTRMAALTPDQRSELGKRAAAKRWKRPAPKKGAG